MSTYITGSLVSFCLFGMGLLGLSASANNLYENRRSRAAKQMFLICICVFFWDFGYAWMGMCYDSNMAYVARAIALLAVSFYMMFILHYVATITEYPRKRLLIVLAIFMIPSLVAWTQIIQPDAVTFVRTGWGYWYYSQMSGARVLQFASVIVALVQYYVIIAYGRKRAKNQRERFVLGRFMWFGPILFAGYMFDTLVPMLFHIASIPGSAVGAFFSAVILYMNSQQNKVFGLTKVNVSQYVFEDVNIPVLITNNQDEIVLFNESAPKYLQCDSELLQNRKLPEFLEYEDETVANIRNTKQICELDKTEVKDQFGDLQYSIWFLMDITKDREAMHMLEESRQVAEEANRAKSNFLANMSHEIRTPMNAIIGMSEIILQDDKLPPKAMSQISEIQVAGQNLLGIINDILDISKIEAGRYELVNDTYELASLIQDVSRITEVRLQESNVAFELKVDATVPKSLIGDVGRIRQVLLNVLGNAVKFCKKGNITLNVGWTKNEQNPLLTFDVIDTGIGIKPENLNKIFGEFNQVDTRKNRNIQGTGLGLAISKHLAELMGGDLTVDSVYGEGSTFHISVRQNVENYEAMGEAIATALQKRVYQTEAKKAKLEIVPRPKAKILVVDDTKVNLMIAAGVMKKYQMQIDTAASGQEAIDKVQQNEYDLVFMDHMMPEMDGVEATRKIRELGGAYEKLTIIALTANAISEAKEKFLAAGLQDFVAKPIQMQELNDALNRWLPAEQYQ